MRGCPFVCTAVILLLLHAPSVPAQRVGACSFLEPEVVGAAIGLPVVNVVERDRGSFTSCSFETEDWTQTVGLIHYPGLEATNPDDLLAQVRADLQRDEVEFTGLAGDASLGVPAVYYRSAEGDMHALVAQFESDRLVLTAGSRAAVFALAQSALRALKG